MWKFGERPVRVLSALLLFVAGAVWSSEASALTLWQVWQEAVSHDPSFQEAKSRLQALTQASPEALAGLLPQVQLQANGQYATNRFSGPQLTGNGSSTYSYKAFSRYSALSWTATLTQPLFDWSALEQYRSSHYSVAAAAANYQAKLETLAVRVVQAYVDCLSAEADLVTQKEAERNFAKQESQAAASYHAGATNIIGMEETQVALQDSRAQVLAATSKARRAWLSIERLTGGSSSPPEGLVLPSHVQLPELGYLSGWEQRARRGNPTLAALSASHRAAVRSVSAAKGGFLPTLSLQLQYNQSSQNGQTRYDIAGQTFTGPDTQTDDGASAALNLSWNIFAGGATRAKVDAAQAREEEAFAKWAVEKARLVEAVRSRYVALQFDQRRMVVNGATLKVAQRAVKAADDGVRAGVITENNAINDRKALVQVRQNQTSTIASSISDYISLAQAAGMATPSVLHRLSLILGESDTTRKSNGEH